eukprot:jgi/Chlat1/1599/Chrsp124S01857
MATAASTAAAAGSVRTATVTPRLAVPRSEPRAIPSPSSSSSAASTSSSRLRPLVQPLASRSSAGRTAVRMAVAGTPRPQAKKPYGGKYEIVKDVMTRAPLSATPEMTVEEALELLVKSKITGLPVVDENLCVVGVVSDYDLLALDEISGTREEDSFFFPQADSSWEVFKQLQSLLAKTQGKTVGDVMTTQPIVVREQTSLDAAARMLLELKIRRLPVVAEDGKLVGILTRGNVVKAALNARRAANGQSLL